MEVAEQKMLKVPKLRFREFEGKWTIEKVGSLCDSIVPGRNKPKDFSGSIPWITTPDIEHNGVVHRSKSELGISTAEAKIVGSRIVPINSVIISCVGDLGLVALAGRELVLNQQLHAFMPSERIHFRFLMYSISTQMKYMDKVATKTAVPYMNKDNCNSIPINHPTLPEQQKIASFLSAVDERLGHLVRKKQLLEQYKKGVMQQLFSQQLRFKREDGSDYEDWEEKRLGEIGKIKMCKRIFNHETSETGDIPFYKIGTFGKSADAFITQERYDEFKSKFSFPKVGDILISAAGTLGRTVVYDGCPAYFQDSNIVWIDNNEKLVTNSFLYYIYQIVKYDSEGGTIQRLYNNIISNAKFLRPSLPEQQKIADFLSSLDKKIDAVGAQITLTQQFKKGLLQELFV